VNSALFQWADFPAYSGKLSRLLPVSSGTITVNKFSAVNGTDQENFGSFELVFVAGTVRGTYGSTEVKALPGGWMLSPLRRG
jgi:hypothetical protein